QRRGTPSTDLPAASFVTFIQNHDQVANSMSGRRIHELTDPAKLRALTTLLLLGPATPMLFQGQEFAASSPFLYFADHRPSLAKLVKKGREDFLHQFPRIATPEAGTMLADPEAEETWQRSKLNFDDRRRNAGIYRLHRDLIYLRREDPTFSRMSDARVD